ncbi:hypothetical protein ABK040_008038 [Willaertia magna]
MSSSLSELKSSDTLNSDRGHIVLLGDSIFDNINYVRYNQGKDVVTHVKDKIKENNLNFKATLLAVDGHIISSVEQRQVDKIPHDASHLFISAGGNNALHSLSILTQPCKNVGEALSIMNTLRSKFKQEYQSMLNSIMNENEGNNRKVTLCTIYYPRWEDNLQLSIAKIGLDGLNNVIIEEAIKRKLPVIDLRYLFSEYNDYANSIEPSHQGGEKIANVIMEILKNHNRQKPNTTIYA